MQQDMHVSVACQQRLGIAGDTYNLYMAIPQRGDNAQQLIRHAAIAQRHHHITLRHHPQITVESIQRVQVEGRRACAGQRGCNLSADVSALADAGDHNLPRAMKHQLHGAVEGVVQLWNRLQNGFSLITQTLNGDISYLHLCQLSTLRVQGFKSSRGLRV